MKFEIVDLDRRKPLWTAFSDLWLDTETSQMMLNYIAREMKESGYSLEELKHIYQHEVAPVVYGNLLVTTGVWTGFDEVWLHSEIQKNISKSSWWNNIWFHLNKSNMFFATKDHWVTLEVLFMETVNHD